MNESLQFGLGALVGTWRIESVVVTWTDTGERQKFFGETPVGWLMLDPGGRLMGLIASANRQIPGTDADRAALFDAMTAYTGRVRPDGPGRFVTTVDLALNPAFGGEQVRFYALEGDRLTIWTPPQTFPQSEGRLVINELVWLRER